jgi:hypothetical protein
MSDKHPFVCTFIKDGSTLKSALMPHGKVRVSVLPPSRRQLHDGHHAEGGTFDEALENLETYLRSIM